MKLLLIIFSLTSAVLALKGMEAPGTPILNLPSELQIETLKSIIGTSHSPQEAIKSILTLATTNKSFYKLINRPDVTDSLINELVKKFSLQGIENELNAALSLRTSGSILWIQERLKKDETRLAKEFTHTLHEAFLKALAKKDKNRAQWMLDKKLIDINAPYEKGDAPVRPSINSTPLLIKSVRLGKDAVEFLLNRGAHINASNNHKWTALMEAVRANKPDIVQLLIDRKANLNQKSGLDQTALDIAVILHRPTIEEILRKVGAKRSSELR